MPHICTTTPVRSRDVTVVRATCDGCDAPRVRDEHVPEAHLWLVTEGAFALRDTAGTRVLDPTTAVVLATGAPFTIRHPAGPDICLSLRGPIVDELAADGSCTLAIEPSLQARLVGSVAACRRGDGDAFAVAEALVELVDRARGSLTRSGSMTAITIASGTDTGAGADTGSAARTGRDIAASATTAAVRTRRERELANALAHELHFRFAEPLSLGELAGSVGVSVFHACHVFRRATGTTLASYRRELRLRHALVMLIDGDAALADIAAATGFASQSHLTNLFRARMGATPGAVRARRAL